MVHHQFWVAVVFNMNRCITSVELQLHSIWMGASPIWSCSCTQYEWVHHQIGVAVVFNTNWCITNLELQLRKIWIGASPIWSCSCIQYELVHHLFGVAVVFNTDWCIKCFWHNLGHFMPFQKNCKYSGKLSVSSLFYT